MDSIYKALEKGFGSEKKRKEKNWHCLDLGKEHQVVFFAKIKEFPLV